MAFAADAGAKESRRGRKRLRYEEQWVKKKRKLAKDKGASYATYKGEQKPAKELASLTCRCPYRCSTDINDEDRQRIFQEFYQLGDHDSQNKYLYGLISSVIPVEAPDLETTLLFTRCVWQMVVLGRCVRSHFVTFMLLESVEWKSWWTNYQLVSL